VGGQGQRAGATHPCKNGFTADDIQQADPNLDALVEMRKVR
jgi:hypothetical protein